LRRAARRKRPTFGGAPTGFVRQAFRMLRRIFAVAVHEWFEKLRSWRGILIFVLLTVIAGLPAALLVLRADAPRNVAAEEQSLGVALVKLYNADVAVRLGSCPPALVLLSIVLLMFTPFATLLRGFDGFARSREPGTEDEASPRVSRAAMVPSEMFAQWWFFCAIDATLYALLALLLLAKGAAPLGVLGPWSVGLWLVSCTMAGVHVGLWTLLGALARKPARVFWIGSALLIILGLVRGALNAKPPIWLDALPGSVDRLLLSARPEQLTEGALVACFYCVASVLGAMALQKRVRPRAPDLVILQERGAEGSGVRDGGMAAP
jgi:ABC-type transport system involved in multi-copper enzyme maturation permease subunit